MIFEPMEVFESTSLQAGPPAWTTRSVRGFGQNGTHGLSESDNSRDGLNLCPLVLWQNSQKRHEVMSVNTDELDSKE